MKPLKIGLIVDQERAAKPVYELVAWARTIEALTISHLIVQERPHSVCTGGGRMRRLMRKSPVQHVNNALWKMKARLESPRVARVPSYRTPQDGYDMRELVPGEIRITPILSKSGFVRRFSESDLGKIREEGFDVLIRCGSGILRGGILSSARLGVLSFHHGDNRINRGGPPGFWEVYHRQERTGFVVQRLTEELDGGDVILRGYIPTQETHLLNAAMLYAKSFYRLRASLLDIARTGQLPASEPHYPYSGALLRAPTLHVLVSYLARQIARSAWARVRGALNYKERWGICFAKSDWREAVLWRGTRVATPAGRFLADPFVATRDGRTCVFAEDFLYGESKGRISAFELQADGARELGTAIEESFHLSFPFLFEYEGGLFMCPESCEAKQIRIYECTQFPLGWQLRVVAMSDVTAADTMIFEKDGLWWMLSNISTSEPRDCGSELYAFWATSPLGADWKPHPCNPVVSDPLSARNGGLLRDSTEHVRVAQGRQFGSYGASARLFRITRLNQNEYAEELVSVLTPEFARGIHGTHHFHSNGLYSVWDCKHWERIGVARGTAYNLAPKPQFSGSRETWPRTSGHGADS
jgi:hypothetical protein